MTLVQRALSLSPANAEYLTEVSEFTEWVHRVGLLRVSVLSGFISEWGSPNGFILNRVDY